MSMRIIVLGGGTLGQKVVKMLDSGKMEITLIDENERTCKELAENINARIICGNGADQEVLFEAGIKNADFFVAVSGNDETNLLSCLVVKEISKAKLATRILNDSYKKIFEKAGVNIVVSPETAGAEELCKLITHPDLMDLGSDQKNITLLDVKVKKGSKVDEKMVSEINEDDDFRVVCIKKGEEFVIPINETIILSGDRVVVACRVPTVDKIRNLFAK